LDHLENEAISVPGPFFRRIPLSFLGIEAREERLTNSVLRCPIAKSGKPPVSRRDRIAAAPHFRHKADLRMAELQSELFRQTETQERAMTALEAEVAQLKGAVSAMAAHAALPARVERAEVTALKGIILQPRLGLLDSLIDSQFPSLFEQFRAKRFNRLAGQPHQIPRRPRRPREHSDFGSGHRPERSRRLHGGGVGVALVEREVQEREQLPQGRRPLAEFLVHVSESARKFALRAEKG
jgi:hypothetical protein